MPDHATRAAGIGSPAVLAKTGKSFDEWFALLDKVGAANWPHKEIAAHLYDVCGCPNWWGQMITVGYEQARGLRVKNQSCSGTFTANASKTISVPVAALYKSWNDPKVLVRWLPEAATMTIRKATVNKSLRITWIDGQTSVEVNFWIKGEAKSQVAVQHSKLASPSEVAHWKAFWASALLKLQAILQGAPAAEATTSLPRTARHQLKKKRKTS